MTVGFQTARLPEKQLSVFVLRFFEGLTFEEISGILNSSIRRLEINYAHAVNTIMEHLSDAERSGKGYSHRGGTHAEAAPLPD
jgi:DNA-directed RNA polymerase specialized sigma24 family protein